MAAKTLYVLYNADASLMGKLRYGFRKICSSTEENPACAACDITHGGLSLNETSRWIETKKEIEANSGMTVIQWHRDELSSEMRNFVAEKSLRYPTLVVDDGEGRFVEVMNSSELTTCKGDPKVMVDKLSERGYMKKNQASL